jgi:hypothetical protein
MVVLLSLSIAALLSLGCTPPPPVIVNPQEGWEAEAERGMLRPEAVAASPTPRSEKWVSPEPRLPPDEEHSAVVTVLADIIGYPFRAVAYLAHILL